MKSILEQNRPRGNLKKPRHKTVQLSKVFYCRLFISSLLCIGAILLSACTNLRCAQCLSYQIPAGDFPPLGVLHQPAASAYRHVYLEGDGKPWVPAMIKHPETSQWVQGQKPAKNPTSQTLLALRLMRQDQADAIYLQRPCYGLKKLPPQCSARWWTHDRYHNAVVSALDEALTRLQLQLGNKRLVLIGHSGGGALAMLLASKRDDVKSVVTLAANLDHPAWTAHHGYLPLTGSLNPVAQPLLPSNISRWHLIGLKDEVIPVEILRNAIAKDARARKIEHPVSHQRGWLELWPEFINNALH